MMIRVAQHTNVSAIRISVQLSQHVNKERACSVVLLKFKTRLSQSLNLHFINYDEPVQKKALYFV